MHRSSNWEAGTRVYGMSGGHVARLAIADPSDYNVLIILGGFPKTFSLNFKKRDIPIAAVKGGKVNGRRVTGMLFICSGKRLIF